LSPLAMTLSRWWNHHLPSEKQHGPAVLVLLPAPLVDIESPQQAITVHRIGED
jgi:hypothetical protein